MTQAIKDYIVFVGRCARETIHGDWRYFLWMSALTAISLLGLNAYLKQFVVGLSVTGMTDQVSWGLYIANFTFLVGMAAAAVMLVVPVYIYEDETLHDIVILGELLAVAVIIMCLLFVTVDLGRPDRFWHMIPGIGKFNWPISMLSWDVIVLNVYLILNAHICGYLVYMVYQKRKPAPMWYIPFVFTAIVWAFSIHTVTAFLYVGLGGRPFWNSAIIAPRFLASAFTAGPGFLILTLQIIRRVTKYRIGDKAIMMLRNIVQVSMIINVFLLFCELFTEFYTDSAHVASAKYLYFGLHGHHGLVPWIWTAMALDTVALVLLMLPQSRSLKYLNMACGLAIIGIWIEKGMGLIIPAFVPSPLGEMVEYFPTRNEWLVCAGIWAFGMLLYTVFLKMTIPVLTRELTPTSAPPAV
ncbi:MAG: polysulfide reductase [Elusimicrobia bacterium CG11_big_fil_rev_8_21_14_0_20_64_6]|nr:MAG: polysulfide reductase [Elusimicrobia bacterium CG11_big_fil_rev_8_21_14_0_20_64_6]